MSRNISRYALLLLSSVCLAGFNPAAAYCDEYLSDEIDIDEDWQGASVATKFGSSQAVHDNDGTIDNYARQIDCVVDGHPAICADGEVSADVVSSGTGTVHGKTGLYYHMHYPSNLGTGTQSLKPFVVEGTGTINTSVTLDFDGLLVVKQTNSGNADDWVNAEVEYSGAIEKWDDSEGIRTDVSFFEGKATLEQDGDGNTTVIIPETYTTDDFPDEIYENDWYNNPNIQVLEVIDGAPGAGQIALASLPDNGTKAEATTHIGQGRTVYYLVYSETLTFDAEGGETYYIALDLANEVNGSAGNYEATYALSDFSHTIGYTIAGGNGITTLVEIDGDQTIADDDALGGANSKVSMDDGTLNFSANNKTLHEDLVLASGTSNTINTNANTSTLAGDITGRGALVKTGAGALVLTGSENTYTGGTDLSAGTLKLGANNVLPQNGALDIAAGASLNMNGNNQTLAGRLSGTGTIEGGGVFTMTGLAAPGNSIGTLTVDATTYTQGSSSSLQIEFDDDGAASGDVDLIEAVNGGNIVIESGATLIPVALEKITGPHTYTFMTDPDGITGTFTNIQDNYAVLDFSIAKANADQDYQLTITRASYASAASGTPHTGVSAALDGVLNAGSVPSDIQAILDSLDTMSLQEIETAYDGLSPDASGGAAASTGAVSGQIQNIAGNRMNAARTGISSGDMAVSHNAWMQGFYSKADQGSRGGISGYDANTRGFALGVDQEINDNLRLGVSYGYGNSDSKTTDSSTDVDGHTLLLYGSYDTDGGWYIDSQASYGFYSYDSVRNTLAGNAAADYDGTQLSLRVDAGLPLSVKNNITLTPQTSLRYSRLSLDSYQETGAPGANLAVDSADYNTATAGLGASVSGTIEQAGSWKIDAQANAMYAHDFVQDDVDTTSRFVSAGTAFKTNGLDRSSGAVEFGTGLTFSHNNGLDIVVDYNGEKRTDYLAHTGILKLRQAF